MTETYILKLAIDDSQIKALEQRLGGIMGIKPGSGPTGSNSEVAKNITKLGAIAVGVGGILGLVKKITDMTVNASPMLQAMLKLFDTSVNLILRPIGDFIGFALRPIMMYFLLYIAIPFYRYFAPFMQKYGNALGQIFASPAGFSALIAGGVVGIATAIKVLSDAINTLASKLGIKPDNVRPSDFNSAKNNDFGGKVIRGSDGKPIDLVGNGGISKGPLSGLGDTGNLGEESKGVTKTVSWVDQLQALVNRIKTFASGKVPKQLIELAKKFSDLIKALPGGALGLGFPIPPELKALLGIDGGSMTAAAQPTPVPSLTSRFTGNSRINSLPAGFTQGSAVGSIGSPSFTIHINAGTVVDPKGLTDMINNQVKNQVPQLVQNSIRRTNIR